MAEQFRNNGVDEYTVKKFIQQEMKMDEFQKGEGATDIDAIRLWNSYPAEAIEIWLHNAFCGKCGSTSFKPGYNLRKGRFSEMDWKLFRSKIADWQELYMEKLNKEYIELLSGEGNESLNNLLICQLMQSILQ